MGWVGLAVLRLCQLALVGGLLGAVAGLMIYKVYSRDLPDPATLNQRRLFETTKIYARDNQTLLYELFDSGQRTVVTLDEMPWALKVGTVAVEDGNFFTNPGVDLRGIVRALYLNRGGQVLSGGSTITQQLVRGVLLSPEERTSQALSRKIREAILAVRLSRQLSKQQILALYLNEVYYGNLSYGVEAAAQGYFGKSVRDLSLAEATLLAGLPQSPTDLNPYTNPAGAKARQQLVLDLMVKQGYVSRADADEALRTPLVLRPRDVELRYPHWVFYVRQLLEQQFDPEVVVRGGLRVVTTLDPAVQQIVEDAAREHIAELRPLHATNSSVVVLDPVTNEVLAMVGSVDYHDDSIDGQVNVALAPRQPGSTLKPLVYAQALADDWTPATIIWDTPTDFGGGYQPQNYDNRFHGPQRLRMALAGSLNIPAVKALRFVGLDRFLDLAHRMGITTLQDRDRYGLAVALGAGEVRLLDLATAYSVLANGGLARPTAALLRVTNTHGELLYSYTPPEGTQVLGPYGPQVAYLIADILSDNAARTPIFGPDSVLRLPDDRPAAVKTGTSNDYHDSWAVGYTPDLLVGVWVGNSDNTPMQEVAGANGAGKIWNTIMQRTHAGKPNAPFWRPPLIEEQQICASTGLPASGCADTVAERFIAGLPTKLTDATYVTVTVGGDGTCLATDQTPAAERRKQTFVVPPADARAWVSGASVPQAPTVACPPPAAASASATTTPGAATAQPAAVAAFTTPQPGELVSGQLRITGSAAGQYELAFGAGSSPTAWTTIASGGGGVQSGLLGQWSTSGLPSGSYTLRLQVTLPGSPQQTALVPVVVDHTATTVRLVAPLPDQLVKLTSSVQLQAAVAGPAARLEFLVDGQVVGSLAELRGTVTWTALAPGRHTITAAAVLASGERVGSAPVVVRVE